MTLEDIKHRFTSVLVRPVQYTDTAKVISSGHSYHPLDLLASGPFPKAEPYKAKTRLQGRARHVSDLSVRMCKVHSYK